MRQFLYLPFLLRTDNSDVGHRAYKNGVCKSQGGCICICICQALLSTSCTPLPGSGMLAWVHAPYITKASQRLIVSTSIIPCLLPVISGSPWLKKIMYLGMTDAPYLIRYIPLSSSHTNILNPGIPRFWIQDMSVPRPLSTTLQSTLHHNTQPSRMCTVIYCHLFPTVLSTTPYTYNQLRGLCFHPPQRRGLVGPCASAGWRYRRSYQPVSRTVLHIDKPHYASTHVICVVNAWSAKIALRWRDWGVADIYRRG